MAEIKSNAASVEFRHVTKIYGNSKTPAVNNISLFIEAGKLVTLLGPSGCGKTTTLRMIAGLELATSGQILIGDADVTRLPATDRDVSMVFQSYALFPHMTVTENVEYGLHFSGFDKKARVEKARAGLELVGLSGFGDRLPSQLSGGQQQRVAVARAIVLEPQVLLFDEPLSNLDAKLRRHVRQEIREIQQNLGLTVVYVTHDQEEALAVSDRIIVMNNAVVAQDGTPRDLYEKPANAFVADFIGEANIFDCNVASVADDEATVHLGPIMLKLPAAGHKPGPAKIAARPSRIDILSAGSPGTLPGKLEKVTYVGSHLEFIVATQFGQIFATSPDVETSHAPGQEVGVGFPKRGPVLIVG
jgi:iron(III) transport system ATP-binding protein